MLLVSKDELRWSDSRYEFLVLEDLNLSLLVELPWREDTLEASSRSF